MSDPLNLEKVCKDQAARIHSLEMLGDAHLKELAAVRKTADEQTRLINDQRAVIKDQAAKLAASEAKCEALRLRWDEASARETALNNALDDLLLACENSEPNDAESAVHLQRFCDAARKALAIAPSDALRERLKAAYEDGWTDRAANGDFSRGAPIGGLEEDWQNSETRRSMSAPEESSATGPSAREDGSGSPFEYQRAVYPEGARFRTKGPIDQGGSFPDVPTGSIARVGGHCNDGRAVFIFDLPGPSHSFSETQDRLEMLFEREDGGGDHIIHMRCGFRGRSWCRSFSGSVTADQNLVTCPACLAKMKEGA